MTARLLDLPDAKGRYPFDYQNAANTDVSKTFARERKRIAEEAANRKTVQPAELVAIAAKVRRVK